MIASKRLIVVLLIMMFISCERKLDYKSYMINTGFKSIDTINRVNITSLDIEDCSWEEKSYPVSYLGVCNMEGS